MVSIGEDPTGYSTHSMRIGGATALFAAGANETLRHPHHGPVVV